MVCIVVLQLLGQHKGSSHNHASEHRTHWGELCAGSLPAAWTFGGPVVAVWGFVIVAACSFLVALSLAELASCYPLAAVLTSGELSTSPSLADNSTMLCPLGA